MVSRAAGPRPVRVVTDPAVFTRELAQQVRRISLEHPGDRPLHFTVGSQQWVPDGWTVTPDVEFLTEIKELLGRESVRL